MDSDVLKWRARGLRGTLSDALRPIIRFNARTVWEIELSAHRAPSEWSDGESLLIVGPDNFAAEMTASLREFVKGENSAFEIEGVHRGDRLFVVSGPSGYACYSYIFFDTREDSRRQAKILGEPMGTPIIGMSYTAPQARGRGLYRKLLNEMFGVLRGMGYSRVICEIEPTNAASQKASHAAGMRSYKELWDWRVLNRLMAQRVKVAGHSKWRLLWVG